ncbi:hypothetical protein [Neptunomonas marina]|uniref:Lipoprotein n=1 Tax=Neptunomonas marina TaxID=1815562 RepID=A0A437QDD9_9GAMM|nr:hypothetical protein [Neptunomonas marina]RVU32544.1 hypothetical protein EOE65_02520 [Neptunomonas marina]
MNNYLKPALNGAAIALAAAGLAACGATQQTASQASAAADQVEMVHCYGVNQCKGHNDCGGKDNACAGHGSCKGSGFVGMPAKACADVGGSVKDDWRGAIGKADLTQCYGVNICKGHNDCKTADNACAGHASCKGTGFVLTTPQSCDHIGGNNDV